MLKRFVVKQVEDMSSSEEEVENEGDELFQESPDTVTNPPQLQIKKGRSLIERMMANQPQ